MPILFNIYINEIIVELNHIHKRTATKINTLRFADNQVHYQIIKKTNLM
jgi:hypothetical protein